MIKRIFQILIIIYCLINFCACENTQRLKVISTSVDNMEKATGVNPDHFFFSWKMISGENNVKQTAYRILLSETKKFSEKNIIWDSGKIEEEQSILVDYKGKKLKTDKYYFWKVKVWDNNKNESEWSAPNSLICGLFNEKDWNGAQWIGYKNMPTSKRLVEGISGYGKPSKNKVEERAVVPLFRKSFRLNKNIESATLFISGLGQYEASINGKKVGNDFLTPGWTNYEKTVLYNTYDVSDLVKAGSNAIGVIVGNGFFYNNRERYRKLIIAYGYPKLKCRLFVCYQDGTTNVIVSSENWKVNTSPITYSSIYGGEDYDAKLEKPGWNMAHFKSPKWANAKIVKAPSGKLMPDRNNPVRVMDTFSVKNIRQLNDSVFVYDFGQNASGIVDLKVKGTQGAIVEMRPGEVLKKDGFISQRGSGSPYIWSYSLKGDSTESWHPRFTYYGFRYVQVKVKADSGKIKLPEIIDLKALHTRNSAKQTGTFKCSNERFNKTFDLINWSIKTNLQSVMTDCPTREKLGWLEQTHLVGKSIQDNLYMYNSYLKQIADMKDAMTRNGLVPSIVPEYINFEYYDAAFRDSPEWGSASILVPWQVYKWYGDKTALQEAWPMMQTYFAYLKTKSTGNMLSHGLGDWYDVGPKEPGYAQLTPVSLVATAMYYYDAVFMAKVAGILGQGNKAKLYTDWAEKIKIAFNSKFYNVDTKIYSTGSQTAMAMPLSMGLVPKNDVQAVVQNMVDSIHKNDNRITAGDVGFHSLVDALTKYGQSELLFEMNNRDDVPGYGYQLKKGCTALAESWQALKNKSMNHLMLGHLMEWFYCGAGGINQTEKSVAYKNIRIEPQVVGDITSAKTTFESPYGKIISNWKNSEKSFILNVEIPTNTTSEVILSTDNIKNIKVNGHKLLESMMYFDVISGKTKIYTGSGTYYFEIKNKQP